MPYEYLKSVYIFFLGATILIILFNFSISLFDLELFVQYRVLKIIIIFHLSFIFWMLLLNTISWHITCLFYLQSSCLPYCTSPGVVYKWNYKFPLLSNFIYFLYLLSPLLATTNLFYVSQKVFFHIPHVNDIIQYFCFSVWVILLSIVPSKSIYVMAKVRIVFFLWLNNIPSCVCVLYLP